jgi:hypothetical protein
MGKVPVEARLRLFRIIESFKPVFISISRSRDV